MADRETGVPPIKLVQQAWARFRAQIGQQGFQTRSPNLNVGAVLFQENGFADESVCRPDPSAAFEDKDPGLVLRTELPDRFRREVNPLKDEMRTGDKQGSGIGKMPRIGLAFSRSRIRGRHGVVYVKFPLPAMIKKAERRIASLLDFCNY